MRLLEGTVRDFRGRTVIRVHDSSFEFSVLRGVESHLVPSGIQADVKVFPLRTCKILDLIQHRRFIVYAIGLSAGAKRKIDVKVMDLWVAQRAQGRFAQDPPNSGDSARLVRKRWRCLTENWHTPTNRANQRQYDNVRQVVPNMPFLNTGFDALSAHRQRPSRAN